jgi:hypothetical protein
MGLLDIILAAGEEEGTEMRETWFVFYLEPVFP